MTAVAATPPTFGASAEERGLLRRVVTGPAEGWTTLLAVAALVVSLAWSIDDATWVGGVDTWTDFLPLAALLGVAFGTLGPKVSWGRWRTHLVGAAFGALLLPLLAGGAILGGAAEGIGPTAQWLRFHAIADAIVNVWIDLVVEDRPFTTEWGHYVLVFGVLAWGTGQFAAHAVFGHRRPLDAVVIVGVVLLANMTFTLRDQLHLLVFGSLAGLLLLARAHAFEERTTWARRRIGDPAVVTRQALRGGAVFISIAVLASLSLTATARSAPLQGLWADLPARAAEALQWIQRYVPFGGPSRTTGGVLFTENAPIAGLWSAESGNAFTARVPANETRALYWRVGVYAVFDRTSWSFGETRTLPHNARDVLLANTADDTAAFVGRREIRVEISPDRYVGRLVVAPQSIVWVDRATEVKLIGSSGWFAGALLEGATGPYTVTARIPIVGDEVDGGLTENRLRAAGTAYPPEVTALYLDVPDGTLGPDARALLAEVIDAAPADNPYDIAKTARDILRNGSRFRYDTDVREETQRGCADLSTVECFARIKAGYCQYYATTMAILLREAGIPTRLAQGFLPGDRGPDGREVIPQSNAHAWVEVYFPGYGWVDFDPTGGGIARDTPIPSGVPVTPRPSGSFFLVTDRPDFSDDEGPRSQRPGGAGPTTPRDPGAGPFIAIGILLLVGVGALAYASWRRGPRRTMHPDQAWRSIGRWAGRFGFGPRPAQTVYEYAGALGDALPTVRPELTTVARAKVEISYGRHDLGAERLRAVAEAHRRLRMGLLRLAFRRGRGRPRRFG